MKCIPMRFRQVIDYIESSEPGVIQIEDDRKMSYLLMKYSNKNKKKFFKLLFLYVLKPL